MVSSQLTSTPDSTATSAEDAGSEKQRNCLTAVLRWSSSHDLASCREKNASFLKTKRSVIQLVNKMLLIFK